MSVRARYSRGAGAMSERGGAWLPLAGALALLSGGGCNVKRTQIIVRIEASADTWARVRSVHVLAHRESSAERPIVSKCFDYNTRTRPERFREVGLTPRDAEITEPVLVAVGLYENPCSDGGAQGAPLLAQEALVSFERENTTLLVLPFTLRCVGVTCPTDETCQESAGATACVPVRRPPLMNFTPADAADLDAPSAADDAVDGAPFDAAPDVVALDTMDSTTPDATPDASPDVAMDASPDARPDVIADASPDVALDVADAPMDVPREAAVDAPTDLGTPDGCPSGLVPCPGGCVDTASALQHCGACGRVCEHAHASSLCAAGTCVMGTCAAGFANCNAMVADGCEVDTRTTATSCGACGTACPSPPRGVGVCVDGACAVSCERGYVPRAGACELDAPRPLAPLSGSWLGTRQPTLRWEALAGADATLVRICSARSCAAGTVEDAQIVNTASLRTAVALTPGWHFWQLVGRRGSAFGEASPTWQFFVGAPGATELVLGTLPDFNGDGFGDVAVVADRLAMDPLPLLIYHGSATGLPAVPSQRFATHRWCPDAFPLRIGDVNGDGFSDLGLYACEEFRVLHGSAAGLSAPFALAPAVGTPSTLTGRRPACAAAGDLDGDGYGDLLCGFSETASAAVVYGSPGGLRDGSETTLSFPTSTRASSFGEAVAASVDLNSDGRPDLAVGAPGWRDSCGTCGGGRVFVYLAPASGGRPARLTPTVTLGASLPGVTSNQFGGSLAWVDSNRDGHADLIVGEPATGVGFRGRVYVYPGAGGTLPATPSLSFDGPVDNGLFGQGLTSIGDIDSDGSTDLLVSSRVVSGARPMTLYLGNSISYSMGAAVIWSASAPLGSGVEGAVVGSVDSDARVDAVVMETGDCAPMCGLLLVYNGASPAPRSPEQSIIPPAGFYFKSLMR